MSFGGLILTNGGRNELAKAETGEKFELTHIVLGEGAYGGSVTGIQSVVSPVMELPVSKIERNGPEVVLECDYNSTDVPRPFYFREIGVVANGVLCFYDNSRDDAEYIDPDSSVVVKQKRVRLVLLISSEVNITATIAGNLYALDEDLERHAGDMDIHVTSEDKKKLSGIEEGAQKNVQADWNETDPKSDKYIGNKPDIPTKAEDIGALPENDLTTSIRTIRLSAMGWYRIAEYDKASGTVAQGSYGTSCTVSMKRVFNNGNNEYHRVELLGIFQKAEFKDLSNITNTQYITKIRNVYESGKLYLEIYYNSTNENDVNIIIENARSGGVCWKVMHPVATSETVSGATVYASMNLPANSYGSASNANNATMSQSSKELASVGSSVDVMPADGHLSYSYAINASAPGLFPRGNNASSILNISRHQGAFYSQLGFSSNGNLYYRYTDGATITSTTPWKQISFADLVTQSTVGLMSADDKVKLDGIAAGANKTTVSNKLAASSYDPVAGNVLYGYFHSIMSRRELFYGNASRTVTLEASPDNQMDGFLEITASFVSGTSYVYSTAVIPSRRSTGFPALFIGEDAMSNPSGTSGKVILMMAVIGIDSTKTVLTTDRLRKITIDTDGTVTSNSSNVGNLRYHSVYGYATAI